MNLGCKGRKGGVFFNMEKRCIAKRDHLQQCSIVLQGITVVLIVLIEFIIVYNSHLIILMSCDYYYCFVSRLIMFILKELFSCKVDFRRIHFLVNKLNSTFDFFANKVTSMASLAIFRFSSQCKQITLRFYKVSLAYLTRLLFQYK